MRLALMLMRHMLVRPSVLLNDSSPSDLYLDCRDSVQGEQRRDINASRAYDEHTTEQHF